MTLLNLDPYKPAPQTMGDADAFIAAYDAVMAVVNGGIGADNFDAGAIFDMAKIMQAAAADGMAVTWVDASAEYQPKYPGAVKLWDSVEAGVVLPAASIATPTLPAANLKHLEVVIRARSDTAAARDSVVARFNGDTAANYDRIGGTFQGATAVGSVAAAAQTSIFAARIPGATATAKEFGSGTLVIPGHADATGYKIAHTIGAMIWLQGTVGDYEWSIGGGVWRSEAAITGLTFLLASGGNFVAGSRITVYGRA